MSSNTELIFRCLQWPRKAELSKAARRSIEFEQLWPFLVPLIPLFPARFLFPIEPTSISIPYSYSLKTTGIKFDISRLISFIHGASTESAWRIQTESQHFQQWFRLVEFIFNPKKLNFIQYLYINNSYEYVFIYEVLL